MLEHIWIGLMIGLLGSLHCIGMCGPIAVALPYQQTSKTRLILGRLLYNIGRVITYGILGIIAGLVGQVINFAGLQQTLSVAVGAVILLTVLLPSKVTRYFVSADITQLFWKKIQTSWNKFFGRRDMSSLFTIGVLNGFLPCGLVYIALAGSVAMGGILSSVLYMMLFGVGTIPAMIVTSLFGPVVGMRARKYINRLLPVGVAVLAILLILRGLSLGIPYISPDLTPTAPGGAPPKCH